MSEEMKYDNYGNKNPDDILKDIKSDEESGKGKLKIFFGYIAGVGKTYSMLKAARIEKNKGRDIVVGYVEPHARPETSRLLKGLEILPTKDVPYKGITLKEFDLDLAIKRKPEIILVDELAHTNAPGSRHSKRYQDIEELLRNGIDVYTTLNVQHLETLNDIVEGVTGVEVKERIPDYIFDEASKVEIIDIEPEELIKRLNDGKIYKETQANRALSHFFTKDNLVALREIALRRIADRLNKNKIRSTTSQNKNVEDHILVCLSASPSNSKVIRAAARMAEAFHGKFTALYVETPEEKTMSEKSSKRLRENIRLAEQLGAQVTVLYGYEPANQIASYAKLSGITKIVLGRSNNKRSLFFKKSLSEKLIKLIGDIDAYFIPDNRKKFSKRNLEIKYEISKIKLIDLAKMLIIIALATAIGLVFYNLGIREANIITIYILGIIIISIFIPGNLYGLIASILTVLSFNFFFTLPRFSLEFYDPEYLITFIIIFISSIISSTLAIRVKNQANQFSRKAYYAELLMESTQKMMTCDDAKSVLEIACSKVSTLLERPIYYSLVDKNKNFEFSKIEGQKSEENVSLSQEETVVASWVVRNNKHAGATTDTLSSVNKLFLSVRGYNTSVGIVGIPIDEYRMLSILEKNLMTSILNQCGIIIERKLLMDDKQKIKLETEQEKWRANMLGAISHDFRTPLTSISGNATILMDNNEKLSEDMKYELYENIYDDSMWLYNLTENLLNITRMNKDNLKLNMEYELISDVFEEALKHIDRRAKYYNIIVENEDDLLMAKMEVRLILQVIINIVNNAIKYTNEGSTIELKAKKDNNKVKISISDNGEGIDDESKKHLFEMFYTVRNGKKDSKRGLGLGLSLCKIIVEAHGGTIEVYDNLPKGTVFAFTLDLKEVKI